jgi:hypothetical protein
MQSLLQSLRESVISFNLTGKQGVAAHFWDIERVKKSHSRWLSFIRHIRVPADSTVAIVKERISFIAGWSIAMHDVQFWDPFWTSARGMDVMAAEISSEFESLFNRDIS